MSLDTFLAGPSTPAAFVQARRAAESLVLTGAVVVRDSRADQSANDRFLDLFEDYFVQFRDELVKDERPQYGYQVVSLPRLSSWRLLALRPGRDTGEY